jgi:Domain of unknown function (DUF4145)
MVWRNTQEYEPVTFICGYCGKGVGTQKGFFQESERGRIYICPFCDRPTYVRLNADASAITDQVPGSAFGSSIDHLSEDLGRLYDESRQCLSVSAYTPAVLSCRKILMHVAVDLGADEGKPFVTYVKWLAQNGHIPKRAEVWVDHIRDAGNEKNHEIKLSEKDEAELLLSFVEMLLKINYEFPGRVPVVPEDLEAAGN